MSIQVSTEQLTGTVKWYNRKKGFGFVSPDSGGEDVFVHHSTLPKEKVLNEGDRISFAVEERKKGLSAKDVTWLNGSSFTAPEPEFAAPIDKTYDDNNTHNEGDEEFYDDDAIGDFVNLGLNDDLLDAIAEAGYTNPTPIQRQAIPIVLSGRDILGVAQTGTGKTASFALPILHLLAERQQGGNGRKRKNNPIRVLVLAPTRELAIQIADSFKEYGQYTPFKTAMVFGGVNQKPQVQQLKRGVDILVATPGRLLDLMGQGYIKLDKLEILVFDEADRMLDMGFINDVRRILKTVPKKRQSLLFSATMPNSIVTLSKTMLNSPEKVSITPEKPTLDAIEQAIYFVGKKQKNALLVHILNDSSIERTLVFTRTKRGANRLVKRLVQSNISAEPIHGNKSQAARQRALKNFRDGRTRVLVATDVLARGIDVEHISHVIQFDLPNESETYVHRIGRTGRAGAAGMALSFCSQEERPHLKGIERLIKSKIRVIKNHPYNNR